MGKIKMLDKFIVAKLWGYMKVHVSVKNRDHPTPWMDQRRCHDSQIISQPLPHQINLVVLKRPTFPEATNKIKPNQSFILYSTVNSIHWSKAPSRLIISPLHSQNSFLNFLFFEMTARNDDDLRIGTWQWKEKTMTRLEWPALQMGGPHLGRNIFRNGFLLWTATSDTKI